MFEIWMHVVQFWASSHFSKHTKGVRNHSLFEGADWWWIVWIYRNHHQVLQVAGLSWRPKLEIRWEHVRESTESTESTQPSIDFMHFVVYLRLSRLHVLTESDPDLTEGPWHWHPWSQWLTDVTQDFMPLPNSRWVLENHAKPLHLPFPSFPSFPHLIYLQVIPPISLVISRWIFELLLPKTWSNMIEDAKNFKLLRSPKVFRWIPSSRVTSSWRDGFPERSVTGWRDEGHGCRAPFAGELLEVKLETSTTQREREVTKGQQTERKGRKETLQMTIDVKAMEAMAAMATGQTGHTGHQDEMQMQRIRVRALALNFFDVVQRLGIMPTHVAGHQIPKPLGGHDFAGSSNEEIFGMGATMSQSISHDSHPQLLALRPRNLTALEAASLPTVSLTVSMAFDFAQVTHGEILLIHAAAGGVGLAAISAARRLGAQLMATAGSAKKMCSLRSRGLLQIASSRDGQAFLSDIYDQPTMPTLVLNSLTHQDFIPRSLSLLGPAGRFVELAKLQAKKTCENWKHPTCQHEFVFFSVCFSTSKFVLLFDCHLKRGINATADIKVHLAVKDMFGISTWETLVTLAFNLVHGRLNQNNTQI